MEARLSKKKKIKNKEASLTGQVKKSLKRPTKIKAKYIYFSPLLEKKTM